MLRKGLLALIALALVYWGVSALVRAFASDETRIRWVLEEMAEGFNETQLAAATQGVGESFRDDTSGYGKAELIEALRYVFMSSKHPVTRAFPYRLEIPREQLDIELRAARAGEHGEHARAKFLARVIEPDPAPTRAARGAAAADEETESAATSAPEPRVWDLRVQADFTLTEDGWKLARSTHEKLSGSWPP
jgi:hypothetical protein